MELHRIALRVNLQTFLQLKHIRIQPREDSNIKSGSQETNSIPEKQMGMGQYLYIDTF